MKSSRISIFILSFSFLLGVTLVEPKIWAERDAIGDINAIGIPIIVWIVSTIFVYLKRHDKSSTASDNAILNEAQKTGVDKGQAK